MRWCYLPSMLACLSAMRVDLPRGDHEEFERWAGARRTPERRMERAQIVASSTDSLSGMGLAGKVGITMLTGDARWNLPDSRTALLTSSEANGHHPEGRDGIVHWTVNEPLGTATLVAALLVANGQVIHQGSAASPPSEVPPADAHRPSVRAPRSMYESSPTTTSRPRVPR